MHPRNFTLLHYTLQFIHLQVLAMYKSEVNSQYKWWDFLQCGENVFNYHMGKAYLSLELLKNIKTSAEGEKFFGSHYYFRLFELIAIQNNKILLHEQLPATICAIIENVGHNIEKAAYKLACTPEKLIQYAECHPDLKISFSQSLFKIVEIKPNEYESLKKYAISRDRFSSDPVPRKKEPPSKRRKIADSLPDSLSPSTGPKLINSADLLFSKNYNQSSPLQLDINDEYSVVYTLRKKNY